MKLSNHWLLSRSSPWFRQKWYMVRETLLGVSLRQPRRRSWMSRTQSAVRDIPFWLRYLLSFLVVLACVVASVLLVPPSYYELLPEEARIVAPASLGEVHQPVFATSAAQAATPAAIAYVPPKDETLPLGEWLRIPTIGINTQLQQTPEPGPALAKGVWVVPEYGKPGDPIDVGLPLIVAGHRFGWKWWWTNDYWRYHSFYRLPELQVGQVVEVIADQRLWQYRIYQGEEAQELSDYDADLILYTCKWLNSPIRHVRYATLVLPE